MSVHAFKEWAVICQRLAEGKQAIILRKGGIDEDGGNFRMQYPRFWLFPTYTHQQATGIQDSARQELERVEVDRPPSGTVRLGHFVQATGAYHVHDLAALLAIQHLHCWSEATVMQRFHYRSPGLYVIPARVFRAAMRVEITDRPEYAGCRTWVEVDDPRLTEDGATPVLDDATFGKLIQELEAILQPTAIV